jgi:acyl carrier protein phosphodiesterase
MLDEYTHWFPYPFSRMFPYMKEQNWLFNYQEKWGIEKSLGGVVRRAAYLTESDTAFRLFEEHYQLLSGCYRQFWADLQPFARQQFDLLVSEQE